MLAPEEIEHKQFVATMRGYDRDEVTAFLQAVANDLRALQHDPPAASAPPVDLESLVGERVADVLRAAYEAAARTEEGARRAAEAARSQIARELADARATASQIVTNAHGVADRIVADASAEAARLLADAAARRSEIDTSTRTALGAIDQVEYHVAALRAALDAATRHSPDVDAALSA